jgi:hypothetical protein
LSHLPIQLLKLRFHDNAVEACADEIFPAEPLPPVVVFKLDLSTRTRSEGKRGLPHNLGVVSLFGVGLEIVEEFFGGPGVAQVLTDHAKAGPIDIGLSRHVICLRVDRRLAGPRHWK